MTLRILFATEHIHYPQGGGGGERNTHELCLALQRQGAQVAVMCSLSPDTSWLSHRNRFIRALRPAVQFPRDQSAGYPVFRGWHQDGMAEVVRRFRPDVAIVQGTHPDRQLRALAAIGVPAGVYIHEVAEIAHLREYAGRVAFLSNSSFTAERLLRDCGITSTVVLPLVDPVFYATHVQAERVLFVNTVPRKGLDIALALAESRPDIPFDFVCSWILRPDQRRALQNRAATVGNINLHAPTRNMRPLYRRAKLLLAPSQWEETWGRVVTEAHINGIPVLASNTGGLPQSVGPGGITLDPLAPIDAWKAALSCIWDRPDVWTSYADAARDYAAREAIRPATIVRQLLDFVTELAASGSQSLI
jgi:glycosyltransferase involved in cell wall biosynthesis